MGSVNQKTISINVLSSTSALNVGHVISSGDSDAYILEVTFGDVVAISGSCQLHFVRGDGQVADRDASDGVAISGNKISYTLDEALYAVSGLICYVQFVNSNLYTPLKISFSGIRVVPGGAPVESLVSYPSWAASARVWEPYDNSRQYADGEKVYYETTGSSYICHTLPPVGTLPTNISYWQIITQKGDQGVQGIQGDAGPQGIQGIQGPEGPAGGTWTDADTLPFTDTGNYFATDQVGPALQQVGSQLSAIDNRVDQLESSVGVYGVRFTNASSAPAGTRIYDSVGLTAVAGVGELGSSDFDAFDVFKLRRCNRENGIVTAYYGEPGYSETTKDVFVEVPAGYSRVWNDGTYTTYAVSKNPFYGAALHPAFKHNSTTQKYVYIAAYMSSYDGSSKHLSRSGALPDNIISRTTARTRSKARGSYAILQDVQIRDWLNILMAVEFATRDMQTAIGRGYCDMPYSASHDTTVAETAVNRVIIANAYADLYVVGQEISIGTSEGNNSIAADRTVTSIDVYDASNKAITFDGAAVTIAIGNNVWSSRQKNGKCDSIGQGTGRAAGTTGKTAVIYRGIENLWGNIWEWVDNLNIRNNQGYTDIEGRIASYNDTDFSTTYSAMSAAFPATNSYMVSPLIDPVSGLSCLPATVGGGSSSYYCDHYYQNTGDCAALVGGHLYYGSSDGPWCWNLYSAASSTSWSIGARLLEI